MLVALTLLAAKESSPLLVVDHAGVIMVVDPEYLTHLPCLELRGKAQLVHGFEKLVGVQFSPVVDVEVLEGL